MLRAIAVFCPRSWQYRLSGTPFSFHFKNIINQALPKLTSGNIWNNGGAMYGMASVWDGVFFSLNNIYMGFDNASAFATFRANRESGVFSINDLVYNAAVDVRVFDVGTYGGSFVTKNLCAYSDAGPLTEITRLTYASGQKHDIDDLLELDPLLDSRYQPRKKEVQVGGAKNVNEQKTTIGAISQEHQFVGRSVNSNPGRLGIIR